MRIAIIGTGAMGSLFAALLQPLSDIVMVGHWAEQLHAVRHRGLTLHHLDGRESRHVLIATTSGSDAAPADLAIIAVKGWQTEQAALLAQQALARDGLTLTLQNGLGNFEAIGSVVGGERVVLGVTSEGATMLRPGAVRHAGQGHTYFAASDNTRHRLQRTAALFSRAGLPASVTDDAQSLIWGKLAVNAGINPLTALLQAPNGFLIEHPRAYEIMSRAATEAAAVARALGIELPFDDAAARAAEVARATASNRSSMAQDIARGTPTEIEQITGAILRHGRLVMVPTPVNKALYSLVHAQLDGLSRATATADLTPDLRPVFRELFDLETHE